jgi:ATP-dependent DNA ligase
VGGYRALGHVVGGGLVLRSRNGVDVGGWFPELAGLAGALGDHAGVLDGEWSPSTATAGPASGAAGADGQPGRAEAGPGVTYLVFDLVWLDGRLLTGLPYTEWRRLLEELEVAGPAWQTVASFAGAGTALLEATREQGLEGVVAERLQSIYLPGRRTRNWLKTKHYQRETFLVGGFVPDRDQVRSLLVGLPDPARPGRPRPGPGGPAAGPRAARAAGHPGEPVRRARGGPAGGRRGPAGTRRPDPGVRPPRGRRRGQLPRLGVGPPPPPCLRRPDPATVEPRTSRRRRQ